MRHNIVLGIAVAVAALVSMTSNESSASMTGPRPTTSAPRRAPPIVDKLRFVENAGQMGDGVAFAALGRGRAVSLSADAMTLVARDGAKRASVEFEFDGARAVRPRGESPTPAMFHCFHGRDGAEHPTHARTFSSVAYDEPWPGVDLRFDARPMGIEYSLVVHSGADVGAARFRVHGAERVERTTAGELATTTSAGVVVQSMPSAWQEIDGARVPVDVAFDVDPRGDDGSWTYRFALGAHDASREVVVDPTIQTDASPLGFSGEDTPSAIAVDSAGNVYLVARVASPGLVPSSPPTLQATLSGSYDGFLAKYDDGGQLVWATYFGSSGDDDYPTDVAVDSSGRAVVAGYTRGTDFPVTGGFATGQTSGAFVARFAADGASLVHSNLFGMDYPGGFHVAVGSDGAAYAAGVGTSRFATTTSVIGAPAPHDFTWVAKIAPNGHRDYLTELWGGETGYGHYVGAVAVDAAGAAYLTGTVAGADALPPAPVTNSYGGAQTDAFAMKLDPSGQTLEYAVFVGGSGNEYGGGIAVDAAGSACVVGETTSSVATFPRRTGDDGRTSDAQPGEGFFVKLSPSGQNQVFALGLSAAMRDPVSVTGMTGVAFDATGSAWTSMEGDLLRVSSDGALVESFGYAGFGRPAVRSSKELWGIGDRTLLRLTNPAEGVAAPGLVTARATSARTARVEWNGVAGATGYVVERANATGGFASVATPDAATLLFDDSGLAPDTNYRYRVRASEAGGPSTPSSAVGVRTDGSFSLHVVNAKIVDSTKPKRDSIRLAATTLFESPTAFDPATDAFHLAIGTGAGAYVLDVPAGAPGWKSKPTKFFFRFGSVRRASPQVRLDVDLKKDRVTLTVTKTDLAGLPVDPAEVAVRAGDEADTDGPVWKRKGDTMSAR